MAILAVKSRIGAICDGGTSVSGGLPGRLGFFTVALAIKVLYGLQSNLPRGECLARRKPSR